MINIWDYVVTIMAIDQKNLHKYKYMKVMLNIFNI